MAPNSYLIKRPSYDKSSRIKYLPENQGKCLIYGTKWMSAMIFAHFAILADLSQTYFLHTNRFRMFLNTVTTGNS